MLKRGEKPIRNYDHTPPVGRGSPHQPAWTLKVLYHWFAYVWMQRAPGVCHLCNVNIIMLDEK